MLPDHVLSTQPIPAQFRFPRNIPKRPLIAYEYGGVALDDPSRGLRVKVYKGEYVNGEIVVSADGVPATSVLAVPNVADFDFTFDQNMRIAIAYELVEGGSRFYWYDTTVSEYVTLDLGSAITPRCAHDDNRDYQTSRSDIILAYVRGGGLYYREQRDRYTIERKLSDAAGPGGLIQIGMNRVWRFQFQLSSASV